VSSMQSNGNREVIAPQKRSLNRRGPKKDREPRQGSHGSRESAEMRMRMRMQKIGYCLALSGMRGVRPTDEAADA